MSDKAALRSDIFRHLDGLVTAPVAYSLYGKGVLQYLLEHREATLSELTEVFKANEGYLNVALRILASQDFLNYHLDNARDIVHVSLSEKSSIVFPLFKLYRDVVELLSFSQPFNKVFFEEESLSRLINVFEHFKNDYGIVFSDNALELEVQHQILKHIEGSLVGPIIVRLGMSGMFHKYFMEISFRPEEFHREPENFKHILDFLVSLNWFTEKNGNYQFTETGLFFARRATSYGVTVSYLPMFAQMDDLLFGNPKSLREIGEGEEELHVHREMNVWGSGGAHDTYFKKVDEIIIKLFNLPINEQPKGILDLGCGNGAFMIHLYEVIERQTLRGKMLHEHPLFLVGVDYNPAALKVTRANLIKADIWAKVIWGDIGRPDLLANDLKENYNMDLVDLLNVRTFLDHNRIWEMPKIQNPDRISTSTGAFAHRGERIPNRLVEDNLLEHFRKWAPYVKRFGLLIIELHIISSDLAAKNLGQTAATAYDATHGFSDQYIVEIEVLHRIAKEAGLISDPHYFVKFPDSELATISINLFKGENF